MSVRALSTSPPPPTVDDMLDWMRDRDRATKRYQQECHQQWALHSPRLNKRDGCGGGTPRTAALLSPRDGRLGIEAQQQEDERAEQQHLQQQYHQTAEVVDVFEVSPRLTEQQQQANAVGGSRSPRSPYATSSSPAGAVGRRSASRAGRIRELEHEELQERVRALRCVIAERDDTIARTEESLRTLKERERVLSATLVQNSIRHAESFAILRREGIASTMASSVPEQPGDVDSAAATSSMDMGNDVATSADQLHSGKGCGGLTAPPVVWWRQNPFTADELAIFGDIGDRLGGADRRAKALVVPTEQRIDRVVHVLDDPDI